MELKRPVTFHIEQLGAIKDATITLKPFMVFSGDSGLGKSYAAFLIHYLYVLLSSGRLSIFLEEKGFKYEDLMLNNKKEGILGTVDIKSLIDWINNNAVNYIGYLIGNANLNGKINIEIPFPKDEITFSYKEEFFGMDHMEHSYMSISLEGLIYRAPQNTGYLGVDPFSELLHAYLVQEVFGDSRFAFKSLILPPGRCSLIGLRATTTKASIGMYEEYLRNMEDFEHISFTHTKKADNSDLIEMIKSINNGVLKRDNSYKLIYETDNIQIPVTAAASSIKELVPLTLLIEKYSLSDISILFEEPEAHIHPAKQVKLADLMVAIVNSGAHFQITTHSNYILDGINDAINLYKLKQKDTNTYSRFIKEKGYSEDLLLDPDKVGAYYFYKNDDGTVSVRKQSLEEGIPYDSFYDVIRNNLPNSMALSQLLKEDEDDF
ncbi:hypothetical protein Barb4_02189 [Bacteroidales bacterium Barb4]|nr:hypothetical protein Barb4_02189 [Bacteroidales bacterium Barb4]